MARLPLIEVEFDGVALSIDVADFDAVEWRALRAVSGLRPGDVLDDMAALDPFALAGLIWLTQRRDTSDLDFVDVAKRVNITHALVRDGTDAEAPPQRRRRQLLKYLPSLAALCNVRPWEIDLLTSAEVAEFLAFIDQLNEVAEVASDT